MHPKTEQFGIHMMFDGYNADPELLSNKEHLTRLLTEVPTKMGMHTISEPTVIEVGPLNKKDPGGISGFILIAESHISYHTFPKRKFVTADIYTCQDELDIEGFTKIMSEVFGSNDYEIQVVKRGTRYPVDDLC